MITSPSNPRIRQVVQWQTKSRERDRDRVFVAEGLKMYWEAPEELIREVYVSTELLRRLQQSDASEREGAVWDKLLRTGYEEVTEDILLKISDTRAPQGIVAVLRQPRYELEDLLRKEPPLLVLVEQLQDPGNLGTILRTGEGAGITGVIIGAGTVDPFSPKVIRATMGSIYRVPFVCVEDSVAMLERLHGAGVRSYAAHLQGEDYYTGYSFREPTVFLIGNEGNGLSRELTEAASFRLKIPMEGEVESLNAGISAALLMYEAHRQRA
ncbi:MAG: RNA methyltransferase [Clostridium sp.]|nr:RNA methyltransferase [Acetatifactor muris]MCM1528290.1 RNA methyltransferase [Bacteroides sp.]MCM1564328.1 RNA methyltransferase [Clostridium sp.]